MKSLIQEIRNKSNSRYLKYIVIFMVMILLVGAYYLDSSLSSRNNINVLLDMSPTLAGIDNNKNGIRDDIDEYIVVNSKINHYNEKQINALKQTARVWQNLLIEDLKSSESIKQTEILNFNACGCMLDRFHEREAIDARNNIKKYTFNTRQRLNKYLQHSQIAESLTSTVPDSEDCDNK